MRIRPDVVPAVAPIDDSAGDVVAAVSEDVGFHDHAIADHSFDRKRTCVDFRPDAFYHRAAVCTNPRRDPYLRSSVSGLFRHRRFPCADRF